MQTFSISIFHALITTHTGTNRADRHTQNHRVTHSHTHTYTHNHIKIHNYTHTLTQTQNTHKYTLLQSRKLALTLIQIHIYTILYKKNRNPRPNTLKCIKMLNDTIRCFIYIFVVMHYMIS